jgi:hypothetical protein
MRRGLIISFFLPFLASLSSGQIAFNGPILSEFLPNQTGDLETEWIELYNPTDFDVDLQEYKIGDELGWRDISDTALILLSGGYIILSQDMGRFLEYYSDFNGIITSPNGWQILNNDGDVVRLGDASGYTIDSVVYDKGFPDNRSRERYIDAENNSFWGGSFDPAGSTPGVPNSYFYPRLNSIDIEISPDPFSPDGDGFEDFTTIKHNPPEAETFELAIYDISGRKVKTLIENDVSIPGEITWDGRGDDGRKLPVGIYIVYARVEGEMSMETKRTVVIAR